MVLPISVIQNSAILIFANSAEKDGGIKNFGGDISLLNNLTVHTLEIVSASGLPYYHFTEKEQNGSTFGERFSAAIQSVFDQGHTHIIAIGNDSPQLKKQHLIKTQRLLEAGKLVVGPSMDGGFYLIGLSHSQFNIAQFKALPWQLPSLLNETHSYFTCKGENVVLLDPLMDVDSSADVKRLSNFTKSLSKKWLVLFSLIFNKRGRIETMKNEVFKINFQDIQYNKGSPLFAFPTFVLQR